MRFVALFAILCLTCFAGHAQDVKKDSTGLSSDSVRLKSGRVVNIRSYASRFDPRKAMFFAAVFPGAGQVYNKKYWKVPLVYGGLGGLFLVVRYWNNKEVYYKDQLFYNLNNPNTTSVNGNPVSGLSTARLRTIVDQTRRQRDYFIIITGIFYILQMVDAHVDAHLKEFDLNPNLHVRVEPQFSPMNGIGAGLTFRF